MRLLNRILLGLAIIFLLQRFGYSAESQNNLYIDKNVCPYEGCFFGFWRAEADFPLYEKPNSSKVIAWAKKGTNIKSLGDEVHVIPDIIAFDKNFKPTEALPYQPNTQLKVLTYLGEGYFKTSYQNKIDSSDAVYCLIAPENCGQEKDPSITVVQKGSRTWWVKVKLKNNTVGWAKEAEGESLPIGFADQLGGYPLLKSFTDGVKKSK